MAQGLLKVFQTVRLRIPSQPATKGTLDSLLEDPDREVRITVADRLPPERLERLVADPDYLARQYVARRLPVGRLFRMIRDTDRQVRVTVAERLPP